jgi:integrase
MARMLKDQRTDLSIPHDLTAPLIERLTCPPDKQQAFLRDLDAKGLRVRVTASGAKSYVFEKKLNRQTIRRTIGDVRNWSIPAARVEARRLAVMLDTGTDPRELDRQHAAARSAYYAAATAQVLTVSDAWAAYLSDRRRHWGDRHYRDHTDKSAAGGALGARGKIRIHGPLFPLMSLPLRDLTAPTIEAWAATEAQSRATSARLAWRLLKAFISWCNEQVAYAGLLSGNPAKTKKARESLGKPGTKSDVLQREQLPAWFSAVAKIHNPAVAAALQVMLLTGARPGEVLSLRWEDINIKWNSIQIRDKVEGTREIPLTPYVAHLLVTLPRRNAYVFSGPRSDVISNSGEIHGRACAAAAIDGLTLNGLRRSFRSLTEWLEVPVGVVAQLMGHKPSATAEKHYTVRPLDLLRLHHGRIEAWVLEQAGIAIDSGTTGRTFRVVAADATHTEPVVPYRLSASQ